MDINELERTVLDKLSSGVLDGVVGDDFITGNHAKITIRQIIENGIPQTLRFGADGKYFDNKENVRIPGNVTAKLFETIPEKLQFLQKFGWLMDDPDVKAYSSLFKPKK